MTTRGLIDANILIYSANADDPEKHRRAVAFMEKVVTQPSEYVVSYQSLREFAFVSIKRTRVPLEKINQYVTQFQNAFGQTLIDLPLDISTAITLSQMHKTPFWDALLASTAQRHEIFTIYTENTKDFENIPGIKAVNPLK